MGKSTVVVDVDDVLFGLNEALESILKGINADFSRDLVKTYSFNTDLPAEAKKELGISEDDETNGLGVPLSEIWDRFHSAFFYMYEKKFKYDVPRFKEFCDKCNVILSTSGSTVDACKAKVAILNQYLNDFEVQACVSVHLCSDYVKEYLCDGKSVYKKVRGSVSKPAVFCDSVIEDSVGNLMQYPKEVMKYLVDKPYNQLKYMKYNEEFYNFVTSPCNNVVRVSDVNNAIDLVLRRSVSE